MKSRAYSFGGFSLVAVIFIALVAAIAPIAYLGWPKLYKEIIERNPPVIEIVNAPRGIGTAPVSIKILLSDKESGLDEVVVRLRQKNKSKEMLRKSLNGANSQELLIEFPGEKSELEEGKAVLEVRTFDRSFWNTPAEKKVALHVDFRKPFVEVITTQHNATQGGSQLVFYRAKDDNLAISGVRVGGKIFPGYPARGIDENFDERDLYVAIYAINSQEKITSKNVRVFAEDVVGNSYSVSFYNKIALRSYRTQKRNLGQDFVDSTVKDLVARYRQENTRLSRAEEISYAFGTLREASGRQLLSLLGDSRFERQWAGPFFTVYGTTTQAFGDEIVYLFEGQEVTRIHRNAYVFRMGKSESEVLATGNGIVAFTGSVGTYGNTVILDHGLGLMSIYGFLESFKVSRGDYVEQGRTIGLAGRTGLTEERGVYYELRVSGLPVDPREWWDKNWYNSHVTKKIEEAKKVLGIPIYRPLN